MKLKSIKEMFERLDQEEDGEVYLREVVDYLAVLDNNIEQSHRVRQNLRLLTTFIFIKIYICYKIFLKIQVKLLLLEYKEEKDKVLDFKEFTVKSVKFDTASSENYFCQMIMDQIKEAGWTRFKPVKGQPITDKDIKKVFRMVDMDKSGAISQLVGASD